ncbi:uncharacterized protein N7473_005679 [Penicillium subrubescens]|uniref:uncharacterized protein n=1 Tax=Penicillium subrubescens TaxID=1316194 RepID=UPI00254596F4|nr:uncharacterized protein N7473_005679 [Penicillium subrubescens]KAJ5896280.1 hypothetical protein N7473_005679 [Penicillium subrubescens]
MACWPNIGLAPTRGNIELIRSDPFGNEKNDDLAFLHLLPILVLFRLGPETQPECGSVMMDQLHNIPSHNHPPGDSSH